LSCAEGREIRFAGCAREQPDHGVPDQLEEIAHRRDYRPIGRRSTAGHESKYLIDRIDNLLVSGVIAPRNLAMAFRTSSGLAKQNTTKSLSSRRKEYVNCTANRGRQRQIPPHCS
jgi:hypothetical protein